MDDQEKIILTRRNAVHLTKNSQKIRVIKKIFQKLVTLCRKQVKMGLSEFFSSNSGNPKK